MATRDKRIASIALILILLVLVSVSHFYKVLILLLVLSLNRQKVKHYRVLLTVGLVALWFTMPKYFSRPWNRVQLVYQEHKDGRLVKRQKPVAQYLCSIVVPESMMANCGTMACSMGVPSWFGYNSSLWSQYESDHGIRWALMKPYRQLEWQGQHPMSGIYSQAFNMLPCKEQTQSVYVIRPRHLDSKKSYPLVVFCHGWLGNWSSYQAVLEQIEGCVVLSIGTRDLSGIFSKGDINRIFTEQIPFLEQEMGYRIDKGNVHLMGLSNGGSACHHAYNDRRFKSVTFVSTGFDTHKTHCATYYVGGCDANAKAAAQRSRANGNEADCLYNSQWNHFLMERRQREFVEFMNRVYSFNKN